jgi:glycosyltransferase involved in cell wall biosynthesis
MVETTTALKAKAMTLSDLALQRNLLAASRIFDESSYVDRAGDEARLDPIGHYLEIGWRQGLEPIRSFPGSFLLPYFATLGITESPAVTWLVLRSAGWPVYDSRAEIESAADLVRNSGLFNEAFYRSQLGSLAAGLDPAIHYVVVGERMGFSPSPDFDSRYYADRYPDVAMASVNLLLHFIEWGRREGRMPKPAQVMRSGRQSIDGRKENIILVCHETTGTGAPVLGWNLAVELSCCYNLFFVHLGDGELTPAFEGLCSELYGPFQDMRRNVVDIEYSLRPLFAGRKFRYAIVNSASSRLVIEACARRFVPTIFLIHEFGSDVKPAASMHTALDMATEIVFPATIVSESVKELHPALGARCSHIIPQGMSVVPSSSPGNQNSNSKTSALRDLTRRHDEDGLFIVLGAGALELRKGVEIFLSTAAAVQRRNPSRKIQFVWVGAGYRPHEDFQYSVYLHEQLTRSGLQDSVTFLDPVSDLDPVYHVTDAFFLSSRLDPLPNVTIDSAYRGIPVIAFRDASGMAEVMLESARTAATVADYADAEAAADIVIRLAEDAAFCERTAEAFRALAARKFDMKSYVAQLDSIGRATECKVLNQQSDATTLSNDVTFDQEMFLGPVPLVESRSGTILRYVTTSADCFGDRVPPTYHRHRRPAPGFHPWIYAQANAVRLRGGVNPLADFVRRGKPPGPWQSEVLYPPLENVPAPGRTSLRVAVHIHFFYPELCELFLAYVSKNQTVPDLLVTTDTDDKAAHLGRILGSYRDASVSVRTVPNRGRDIGPLLTALADDIRSYDVVGHVHGKRSPYTGNHSLGGLWGVSWRDFLWQNLVGGIYPMTDRILSAFAHDPKLGLVFPSDPNLCGWDENRDLATTIAARMGWVGQLPDHFDFPVGTMFWARVQALEPLLRLRLAWDDYPAEPLAHDGTLLHAVERLLVFSSELAGFHHAVTHVPGITWIPPG